MSKEVRTERLLDREVSAAATREIRRVGAAVLRELVDEGLRVFERCSLTARGGDEHIGILFPFLHLIELLDGVEIALDAPSVTSGQVVMRAAFEAFLTVEWNTRAGDMKYAAAYVVADIHDRIAGLEAFVERHPRQLQRNATYQADELTRTVRIPPIPDAADQIRGFRELLSAPHLREAAEEYERTAKLTKNPPHYALWSGPRTVEQLARKLGRGGQYQLLYRSWSRTVHANDLMRQLAGRDGQAVIRPLRSGDGLTTAYTLAISYGVTALRAVLKHYRPEEISRSFVSWYRAHISQGFRAPALAR